MAGEAEGAKAIARPSETVVTCFEYPKKGDSEGPHSALDKLIGASSAHHKVIEEEKGDQNLPGGSFRKAERQREACKGVQDHGWSEFLQHQQYAMEVDSDDLSQSSAPFDATDGALFSPIN